MMNDEKITFYIATPVNGRTEHTLEEKQAAARQRIDNIKRKLKKHYPHATFKHSFKIIRVREGKPISEASVMGLCTKMVMESDIIFMDDNWWKSQGCKVERFTAQTYGKQIWTTFDLSALDD